MPRRKQLLTRAVIFVHRWLGVALCMLFLVWFLSGIAMMYWEYPSVQPRDRLAHSWALAPAAIQISPADAYARLKASQAPGQVHLDTFDGRPAYRFRVGRSESIVYADTGEEQTEVPAAMMARIASAWTGKSASAARVEEITDVDQWTLQVARNLRPLRKYSWASGEEVYVSTVTGDVVQHTTRGSRLGAYVGAIPHWLYFTSLRKRAPTWSKVVIWSSGIATGAALLGIAIGVWMYSPSKRYLHDGIQTSIPYRGQKRWHAILGLIFGIGAVTWAFSGMLSMDPFPSPARQGTNDDVAAKVTSAFRGRAPLAAFSSKQPSEVLQQLAATPVKALELTTFAGEPIYLATLSSGETRIVPLAGEPRASFDPKQVMDLVASAGGPRGVAEFRVLEQYDRYYLDRHRQRPLPVVMARLNDPDRTRIYIDPKTGRLVGSYGTPDWIERWLYHGLHSLDFPWLYNYRPLWDVVVIAFMLGGTALCVTSIILAVRILRRKALLLSRARVVVPDDDLVVSD